MVQLQLKLHLLRMPFDRVVVPDFMSLMAQLACQVLPIQDLLSNLF
jgi:hypothetical protein